MKIKTLIALSALAAMSIVSPQTVSAFDTGNTMNQPKSMNPGVVSGSGGGSNTDRSGKSGYNPRSRRAAPRGYGSYGPPSGHGYGPARGYGYGGFPGYGGQPNSAPYGSGAPVGGYSVPGGFATPPGGSFSR